MGYSLNPIVCLEGCCVFVFELLFPSAGLISKGGDLNLAP